jgi:hypothetical protein
MYFMMFGYIIGPPYLWFLYHELKQLKIENIWEKFASITEDIRTFPLSLFLKEYNITTIT